MLFRSNFHLTAEEVAYILSDSEARILFVGPETAERGLAAAAESNVHTVIGWGDSGAALSWSDWLAGAGGDEPDETVPPRPNLLYTSGTTGRPKGTELPPTMFAGGDTVAEHLGRFKAAALERSGGFVVRNWWSVPCITQDRCQRPDS